MANKVVMQSVSWCMACMLFAFSFVSLFADSSSLNDLTGRTVFSKISNYQASTIEPLEEKEGKDFLKEVQQLIDFAIQDETALSHLVSTSIKMDVNSVSSFGNTTNIPLYLAKQSFLI